MVLKTLVLGKTGMLGFQLLKTIEATGYGRDDFDVMTQMDALLQNIEKEKFDVVVNCLGIIKSAWVKATREDFAFVNSYFPHRLARSVNSYGGKVIHLSTDCVFDGTEGNYATNHPYTAKDVYGMSKALGELDDDKNLTIRTSIIGRENGRRRSLVEWFLQQKECNGFTNHLWSGLTTTELSKVIKKIIEEGSLVGIKQVALPKPVNKYDLLCLLKKRCSTDTVITPFEAPVAVDRSLISDVSVKPIEEQIAEMAKDH